MKKNYILKLIQKLDILKLFKKQFKKFLKHLGIEVYRSVNKEKVLGVIDLFKPHDLGYPLIRVGGKADGGYLIPDIMDNIKFCFSPGVGLISEFENEIKEKGIKSFLADNSVEGPAVEDLFKFDKKFIKSFNSENSITFNDWVDKSVKKEDKDFLVQMDIEGSEYEVINSISNENMNKIKIFIIEFHHLQFMTNEVFLENLSSVLKKLLNYFEINHIHPNNASGTSNVEDIIFPNTLEVTFLNKKFVKEKKKILKLPNILDKKNIEKKNDIILPNYWF